MSKAPGGGLKGFALKHTPQRLNLRRRSIGDIRQCALADLVTVKKRFPKLDPDFAVAYAILAVGYQVLDRLGESKKILRQADERQLQIPDFFYPAI
jgi:hypothetical protein